MFISSTTGKRFLVSCENVFYPDIAEWLNEEFGPQGYKIPTRQLPKPILTFASFFSNQLKEMRRMGETPKHVNNERLRTLLGIQPIPVKQSVIAMGYTLIEIGRVAKTDKYRGRPSN
ncbi:NADPH-dependent methylglyoxal reductase grp2 [Plakobranchus ocellatus]|uniref:NADPH-dependent methylglyoxal reductase grp2 n=1 Tax=Plakobranchus ocellatus TaxID=259542 RepID=A0AAV4DVI2_9GAST|nr:NADPH-dependent methylglyoxal reductase grp2 [Plakobranchus ocellatus]